jgi:hypothetical protein
LNLPPQNYGYLFQSDGKDHCYPIVSAGFSAPLPHPWQLSRYQQAVSVYIIRQISQTYFGFSPQQANRSYQKVAGPHGLNSKYMFDSTTNLRSLIVTLSLTLSKFFVTIALSLNLTAEAMFIKILPLLLRTISRIRPYVSVAVILIEQLLKDIAVMSRGWCYFIIANQLVPDIYIKMILVTIMIFAMFLYPASIGIFLPSLVIAPVAWYIAVFNVFVLIPAVTLLRSGNYTGINNLALLSRKTLNSFLTSFASVSCSLNNQIVLASGTVSPSDNPRNLIKLSLSLI